MLKAAALIALSGSLLLSGCGFTPIYATTEVGSAPLNQRIALNSVAAPEAVAPFLNDALNNRIVLRPGEEPRYQLFVEASERADRLAVQIDATVTRYNYRLFGRYTLIDVQTGERITGSAQAVTSYNIVTSQYSTLFAERNAQQKAARVLAEEIERDLLIRFSDEADTPDFDKDDFRPLIDQDRGLLENPDREPEKTPFDEQ